MEKQSFLLSNAHNVYTSANESWVYDENLHLNVIQTAKESSSPVCLQASMITKSKTEAAPGDDDPDPDVEFCY